jgi:hypothetical protein
MPPVSHHVPSLSTTSDALETLLADGRPEPMLVTFFRDVVKASQAEIDAITTAPSWPARVAAAPTVPREVRLLTRKGLIRRAGMMVDSWSSELFDHNVERLRRDWVAAYRAWTQVANDKALSSTSLSVEQRAALHRYRAAETAYFTYRRTTAHPQVASSDS